jgi:hypothetical protein
MASAHAGAWRRREFFLSLVELRQSGVDIRSEEITVTSKIAFLVFLGAFVSCPLLLAQKDTCDEPNKPTRRCLQPWELEQKARFARAFQYQLGLQEQPGTATIQNGSTVQFIPNPEHYLVKHSLTFQFSELFLTSSDFASALKEFFDSLPKNTSLSLANLCKGKKSALNCVASSGPWWQRAISGVKVQFSLSERTRVASGIIVPAGPFPSDYDKAGQIDFDPTQIFILGSNWKNAAEGLAGVQLENNKRGDTILPDCFLQHDQEKDYSLKHNVADCVKQYGGSKYGGSQGDPKERFIGVLSVAVPTFKYLRQTQFDFLKNGGVLTPAPFPESALNSYTFTWDLKRLIAPAKEHIAVAEAMKTYNTLKKPASDGGKDQGPSPQSGTRLCVTISNGQKSYMPISDSFPESSCERFAQTMSEGHFKFACVAKNGAVSFGDEGGQKPTGGTCAWTELTPDSTWVAHRDISQ